MFSTILIGTDGHDGGRDALALARRLAAPGAVLILGHIWEHRQGISAAMTGSQHPSLAGNQLLQDERLAAKLDCAIAVRSASSPAAGLRDLAAELGCDLLVVGTSRGHRDGHIFEADDARATLHGAPCAVAVAPRGYAAATAPITSIGFGYEETDVGNAALEAARELGGELGAQLHVIHVVPPLPSAWMGQPFAYVAVLDDVSESTVQVVRSRIEALGDFDVVVRKGIAELELRRFARTVGLLVLGTRGHGAMRRMLLGSTSSGLVDDPPCPVLVLVAPHHHADVVAGHVGDAVSG